VSEQLQEIVVRAFDLIRTLLAVLMAAATLGAAPAPLPSVAAEPTNTFPDGSTYLIEKPSNWNGALLLYSHGYRFAHTENQAVDLDGEIADLRPILLARGYALAGSSYATTGYAVDDALRDQMSTLDEFVRRYGRPKLTIAWGHSLGGLISVGLIERHPDRFDGGLAMCGPLAGSESGWNELLDSEFVLKKLAGDDASALDIVGAKDPTANLREAQRVFGELATSPAGRARLALAAGFAEEPGWDEKTADPPAAAETEARVSGMLSQFLENAIPFGFFARQELEARAGGNPSSNAGESYFSTFHLLPERGTVAAAYKEAGLDLDADLHAIDATPRIVADSAARAYVEANTDVGATLPVPILTLHTIADGLVPAEHERTYAETVPVQLREPYLRQLFVKRAGHCAFTAAETLVALESLLDRLRNGSWSNLDPEDLNESAHAYGDGLSVFAHGGSGHEQPVPPAFIDFVPKAFLR
jgi:pimeloyl-ACP methyl ester carboxylesterase